MTTVICIDENKNISICDFKHLDNGVNEWIEFKRNGNTNYQIKIIYFHTRKEWGRRIQEIIKHLQNEQRSIQSMD